MFQLQAQNTFCSASPLVIGIKANFSYGGGASPSVLRQSDSYDTAFKIPLEFHWSQSFTDK